MTPELRDYRSQLEAIIVEARELLDGLTDEQARWQPAPGQWSVGQCVSHLITSGAADLPHLKSAVQDARSRGIFGEGPFRYNPLERLLTRSMDAPSRINAPTKIRVRNPKVYAPAQSLSAAELTREFFAYQDELMKMIEASDGLHLRRVKVRLPMTSLFRLSLGQEIALTLAHERRHLAQARRVKSNIGFPDGS